MINSLSNSLISRSGASGPFNILKLLSNNACASLSYIFTNAIEAVCPPDLALAQTTPVVISLTAPGCKVKGPADCKNLLSAGIFPAVCSVHSVAKSGSDVPGNIKLQGSVVDP